ncbi:MAG TPA: tetratricopeptide repeat protein, partial [Pilimelia sp.]|nr:tetratricopeptide repeat protein [Pilimelia sp.]
DLADKSGVSVRALSNLERGRARAAQRRSAEALADALGLVGEQRAKFVNAAAVARQRSADASRAANVAPPSSALCTPPAVVSDFVGRARELARLRTWARRATDAPGGSVISVVGPPGIGKTTLAAAAVRLLAADFPDGCLAIDLRSMDETPLRPGAALDRMLRALGVDSQHVPRSVAEQSNMFRSMLPGRRMLVLLDNATGEAQVRPLLAASKGCVTLITCRRALSGLEGARWLWLEALATPHAVDLVASIARPGRVRAEPEAARELVELCGNLPLAVRIAGNRLARQPRWSLTDLTAQLRDERTRLARLTAGDLQIHAAFAVSYQQLSPTAQFMLRRLALVPGADFGPELAAVAAGTDHTDAHRQLDELVEATLVQPATTPGRFQFHDLIRLFAQERLEAEEAPPRRNRAEAAMYDNLLSTATASARLFDPDTGDVAIEVPAATGVPAAARDAAARWLERESANWLAAAQRASMTGQHRELIALSRAMHWFSDANQQYPWVDIFEWGVAAARAVGDRPAEVTLLNFLGWAQGLNPEDPKLRLATHGQALATAVEIGDRREQAWALGYLGATLSGLGRSTEALDHIQRSTALFTELGYWPALNAARNTEGRVLRRLGRYDDALAAHRAVLSDLRRRADQMEPGLLRYHRAITLLFAGKVMLEVRDWHQAAATFRDARELTTAKEQPMLVGQCAYYEGRSLRRANQYAEAAECFHVALSLFADVTTRWWRARTLAELAATLDETGDPSDASARRREALTLCEALDNDRARALAAEILDAL